MRPTLNVSLERIQRNTGSLFTELTQEIEGLMNLSILSQRELDNSNLSALLKQHTGMSIGFEFVPGTWDAYCHLVEVDKNHVFFHQRNRMICHVSNNYRTENLQSIGAVDLKAGTVSGVFAQYPVRIGLGELLFKGAGNYQLTAKEVAAILLHETGHAFTAFEYLGKTVMTGLVISSAVKTTMGLSSSEQRTKIIINAAHAANLSLTDDNIASVVREHGENADVVLLTQHVRNLNRLDNTSIYDARNCEQVADQFATAHGAGPALVASLEKLHKWSLDINYRSTFTYVGMEALKVMGVLLIAHTALFGSSVVFLVCVLIALFIHAPGTKIYDDPKDRMTFIKRQLVEDLRHLDAKKQVSEVKDILKSIDAIDAHIEQVKDRKSLMTAIYDTITPWGRNREQQEAKQKLFENSINNDLYIQAATFSTL